ncbi:MAG: N-acetylglucosamine-6-phosphate deacetylase [Lentisphaerae bacterium]|nr:N-acetylglucosamine-6-phosphate deacetylase [Lentisphaerota bacterium]MCP4101874.1 N-acetylglucosamine-6-phosphate deacetylase [Lentisphaerota bacterium]
MKKNRKLFITDYCLTPLKKIEKSAILCQNDKILAIGGASAFVREEGLEIYDFDNAYATPGFIDTHIHGAGGFDSSSAHTGLEKIEDMSRILVDRGVTTFIPTVVSDKYDVMLKNLNALSTMMSKDLPGAEAVGINIEGPFINPQKSGSQESSAIRDKVDLGFCRELLSAANGMVKKMTFAPELDGAVELVELLRDEGVIPSMGHSLAQEKETLRAIDAGARSCTHLFNGMPPLHQRRVTLTGIMLTDARVSVELIIDGRHLHPRMVDLACRCKPFDKVIGISDGTMGSGMPSGEYHIGPTPIKVDNGFSQNKNGLLAGTTTLLDTGWHSLMSYSHMREVNAAACVTSNAAKCLNLEDRGLLQPLKKADIAFFERGTNRPLMTVCGGKIVFQTNTNLK